MSVTKELHTWEVTVTRTGTDPNWTEMRVQAQTVSWEGGALAFRTDGQLVKGVRDRVLGELPEGPGRPQALRRPGVQRGQRAARAGPHGLTRVPY